MNERATTEAATGEDPAGEPASPQAKRSVRQIWRRRTALALLAILAVYLLAAYVSMPLLWKVYAHRHPELDDVPGITLTGDDHPGDPINVAMIGSEEIFLAALKAAGWRQADALGLRSDVRIAVDTVIERPFDQAPVSNLFLFGRKEDFAFELPVGDDPRSRHHVRFWRAPKPDEAGRPVWVGSAAFDKRVGFSDTTGQITHHIGGDVDAERDFLLATLQKTTCLASFDYLDDFHQVREGVNGGGDRWHTDGRLLVGTLKAEKSAAKD